MRATKCLAALLIASGSVSPTAAQVLYGSAVGTLQDQTGAVITSAVVTMTSKETGATREIASDREGRYTFANLAAGSYDLKVTAPGFRTFEQTGVQISINTVSRVDVRMELGAVGEQVTVEANAVALQTDKSDLRSEITSHIVGN